MAGTNGAFNHVTMALSAASSSADLPGPNWPPESMTCSTSPASTIQECGGNSWGSGSIPATVIPIEVRSEEAWPNVPHFETYRALHAVSLAQNLERTSDIE